MGSLGSGPVMTPVSTAKRCHSPGTPAWTDVSVLLAGACGSSSTLEDRERTLESSMDKVMLSLDQLRCGDGARAGEAADLRRDGPRGEGAPRHRRQGLIEESVDPTCDVYGGCSSQREVRSLNGDGRSC